MCIRDRCYRAVTSLPPGARPLASGREAFQALERAGRQQLAEGAAVGQFKVDGDLRQGVENERAQVHLVMGYAQARLVDQPLAEQQDVQVQSTRPPALDALAALIQFDGLQGIEQLQRLQLGIQRRDGVGVTGLAGQQ